jgi:hypothetical protein
MREWVSEGVLEMPSLSLSLSVDVAGGEMGDTIVSVAVIEAAVEVMSLAL